MIKRTIKGILGLLLILVGCAGTITVISLEVMDSDIAYGLGMAAIFLGALLLFSSFHDAERRSN